MPYPDAFHKRIPLAGSRRRSYKLGMDDLSTDKSICNKTVTRDEMQALTEPGTLTNCNLEDEDLSKIDLSGWKFELCNCWSKS